MFDLRLPDFEIIFWIKYNDFGKQLEKEISPITAGLEIYEEVESGNLKAIHWIIPSWEQARKLGQKLNEHNNNPNLVLLKLKANNDSEIQDITLKDERRK